MDGGARRRRAEIPDLLRPEPAVLAEDCHFNWQPSFSEKKSWIFSLLAGVPTGIRTRLTANSSRAILLAFRLRSQPQITLSARTLAFAGRARMPNSRGAFLVYGVAAGSAAMNDDSICFGHWTGYASDFPFSISTEDARRHVYVVGQTG